MTLAFVLPMQAASGPANMALDEALLELAGKGSNVAYLRAYTWSVPTLSLGYFQRTRELDSESRWSDVPLVRRASGGGAIWHDHDLTYLVVLPAEHALARTQTALYGAVHGAILDVLRESGLPVRRRGSFIENSKVAGRARPFLCFMDHDADDLVCDGFKVVGSAQRRRAGAILQHGTMLLRSSAETPELRGLGNLGHVPCAPGSWAEPVLSRIAERLGLTPKAVLVPAEAENRAKKLEISVYREARWSGRR